jgi:nicotinic acetylcholine receptor, invertebrate
MNCLKKKDDNSDNKRESANDLSSKSLLANVLDINDDFGVVGPVKSKENKIKSKLFNDQIVFFKRENSNYNQNQNCENCGDSAYSSSKGGGDSYPLKKNLHAILRELRVLTKKIKDDDEDGEKELNWKFAAMVIDRLCMWIFAFATFFSTTLILLTSKNFFKFK